MTLPASANLPNYPGFLNARQYDAEFLRMMNQCAAFGEGVAPFEQSKDSLIASMGDNRATDLEVTTGGSGLNVSVAAGNAWVQGDSRSTQGLYFCYVDVAKTVTLASNSSGNPRIDAIILQVADSDASGALNQWSVTVQQGTAAVGATLANLTGAPGQSGGPTLNGSALLLAYVLVPNGFAGPFVNATHILDRRWFAYRPGRRLAVVRSAVDLAGVADHLNTGPITSDGHHRVHVEAIFHTGNSGAVGTVTDTRIRDGAGGTGNIIDRGTVLNVAAGSGADDMIGSDIAATTLGLAKTFYLRCDTAGSSFFGTRRTTVLRARYL